VAALSVGAGIIRLRRAASRIGLASQLESPLEAIAEGHSGTAVAVLGAFAGCLRQLASSEPQPALRMRGQILGIQDALVQHRSYFDGGSV
jgi:hypothetical protein